MLDQAKQSKANQTKQSGARYIKSNHIKSKVPQTKDKQKATQRKSGQNKVRQINARPNRATQIKEVSKKKDPGTGGANNLRFKWSWKIVATSRAQARGGMTGKCSFTALQPTTSCPSLRPTILRGWNSMSKHLPISKRLASCPCLTSRTQDSR